MAAFSAELEVDGQTYPVVYCDYSFSQATGSRGQVREKVRHGLLEVVLDVPRGDQLMVWAATPHYPLSGHVSFFQVNTFMAHETVSFQDGQCIGYREEFEAGADGMGSYRCTLTIAAAKLTLTAGGPPTSAAAFAQAASPRAPGGGLAATARRAQDTARQVQATAAAGVTLAAGLYAGGRGPSGFGDTKGQYSGRLYDAENCGGPVEKLDWRATQIKTKGITAVKQHLRRFAPIQANQKMVARLEQIAAGKLVSTDFDKRYYTHELREHERYRALGIPDGVDPGYEVWNNAHSATLEDYKLNERALPLYHPDITETDFES